MGSLPPLPVHRQRGAAMRLANLLPHSQPICTHHESLLTQRGTPVTRTRAPPPPQVWITTSTFCTCLQRLDVNGRSPPAIANVLLLHSFFLQPNVRQHQHQDLLFYMRESRLSLYQLLTRVLFLVLNIFVTFYYRSNTRGSLHKYLPQHRHSGE